MKQDQTGIVEKEKDTYFEFEGVEIAKWVCLCIIVAGLLIGSVFWVRGNQYNIHYYVYALVVYFIIPYYLIGKSHLNVARLMVSFGLPVLMMVISIIDKKARIESGTLDPANFLDIRLLMVCALVFPLLINPLRPSSKFWMYVIPSVFVTVLFDPIHTLFNVGYEETGLGSIIYFLDVNLFSCITTAFIIMSIVYLKTKTAASIIRMKQTVQSTSENAEQLNFMVENATQGTWKWSSDEGTFEWSDKTKRFLDSSHSVCNANETINFIHPEDQSNHLNAFTDTLTNRKIYNTEIRIKDPLNDQANYQWVQSLGEVIRDESGKITKMLGLFIDIKDRKQIQLELERRNKMLERINSTLRAAEKEKSVYLEKIELQLRQIESKNRDLDQFAYVVSHDLKAPLRAINNLAAWIEEDIDAASDEVQSNFHLLKSRVERLDNFIDGLLEYSRVGRIELALEKVDLSIMIADIAKSFENDHVIFEKTSAFPTIKSYKILLHQLFQNLISNAIKHNDKEQSHIILGYDFEESSHIFTIKDNGPGIHPELREKVFKIFQTLKPKDEQENTGIGLSIVKKIIEEMEGTIGVCDSDEGTLIQFSIPDIVERPY